MATIIEFRNGTRTEHEQDENYLDDAWRFAERNNRIIWAWYKMPFEIMEGVTMWMRDQKQRDERKVIHAAERFTTQRRIETRRISGMATRVIRRRPNNDDDLPPAA